MKNFINTIRFEINSNPDSIILVLGYFYFCIMCIHLDMPGYIYVLLTLFSAYYLVAIAVLHAKRARVELKAHYDSEQLQNKKYYNSLLESYIYDYSKIAAYQLRAADFLDDITALKYYGLPDDLISRLSTTSLDFRFAATEANTYIDTLKEIKEKMDEGQNLNEENQAKPSAEA